MGWLVEFKGGLSIGRVDQVATATVKKGSQQGSAEDMHVKFCVTMPIFTATFNTFSHLL